MSYNRRFWPGYIPPKEDELLSSWIFRLSREHHIKPYSFTKFYFQTSQFWNRDIDKWVPEDIIITISSLSPLTSVEIKNLLLSSYENIVFNGRLLPSFTEGVSNLGVYHRTRKRNGLLCCPNCLATDSYYKKTWRLLTSIICLKCQHYLIDSCPKCFSPIIFQRLEIGQKNKYQELSLCLCWNCQFNLGKTARKKDVSSLAIEYQSYILESIETGHNSHTGYSFFYFKILLLILRKIATTSKTSARVQSAYTKEFGLIQPKKEDGHQYISLNSRARFLPYIYYTLKDWPDRFLQFCKKHKLRYSDFSTEGAELPFWFFEAFRV